MVKTEKEIEMNERYIGTVGVHGSGYPVTGYKHVKGSSTVISPKMTHTTKDFMCVPCTRLKSE